MNTECTIDQFEAARAQLLGVAYRILGSLSDAEDAVQDTYLKWAGADVDVVQNPTAWLTTVCTRRCIDILRKRRRARVDYVGSWLPEPIQPANHDTPESQAELASSLSTAFMMVLERLTPKERAAYILREVFDVDYVDIAETLETSEAACRKLVSRASSNIALPKVRTAVPAQVQARMLSAFKSAVQTGELTLLKDLLSENVRLHADGGGKVLAALNTLVGIQNVSRFITEGLFEYWKDWNWSQCMINGQPGLMTKVDGQTTGAISFAYDDDHRIVDIFIVRNPDKLLALHLVNIK